MVYYLVPSHVGDFADGVGEADVFSGQKSEAFDAGGFFAFFKEELVAEADAEEGFFGGKPLGDGFDEGAFLEVFHGVAKCANARQDNGGNFLELVGCGDSFDLCADFFEGFFDAAEVAASVVNQAYGRFLGHT